MKMSAIALAIPLAVLGLACRTSSTQGSSGRTASAPADSGTSGTAASGAPGQATDQGATASGDVRAHADDRVVSGRLSQVSSDSITITTDAGDETTLQVVPQTTVTVDGRDAQAGDLQEGQPVRASFNDVEGQHVAVEVRAGAGAAGEGTVEDQPLNPDAAGRRP